MRLVTAEQMRRLDRATIDAGTPGETLMERAGAGVVEALERRYGPSLGLRVLVLCGTGNNGGDGFVAARHLLGRGAEVHVALLGERARVRGEALAHLEQMRRAGLEPVAIGGLEALERLVASRDAWDFALDALLGTGAHGEPEGLMEAGVEILRRLDEAGTRVVALDLPTGVDADTGAIARRAVRADLTVTFGCPKRGQLLYPGRAFVGALEVVDIGLAARALDSLADPIELATASAMAALLPTREPRAHKGSVGRVLVAGGSVGLTGAVALAARAALRSGAGYVKAAVPKSLNDVLEMKLTEEMTIPMPETPERTLALAALEPLLARAGEADAVVMGSGLSRHREAAELARRVVAECDRPLVLDADGLSAFEGLADAFVRASGPRVLTPHLGEMRRLTGLDIAMLDAERIDVAREWARRWHVVLVLKGAPTVTAGTDGETTVNPTGNPGLATAGTGDVLAGVIAAFIAQGLKPYDAARLGAYVHGLAGDQVAAELGPLGLVAGDIAEAMPRALRTLLAQRTNEAGAVAGPGPSRTRAARATSTLRRGG